MTATPVASPPQHMRELAHANRVRRARSDLRHRLERGETQAAEVLADVPPEAKTLPVLDLLCYQPRWGRTRALRVLDEVPVRENKPLGDMTCRQRDELIRLVS